MNHLGPAWQIHPRQLPVPCQQQSITSPATTNTMSSRRTSARLSNDAPSSVATTSAVTLNGSKRKDDQAFGDGKTARTSKKPKVPPPPPSERKIARRRESTRQIRARDQSDSPPLFPVKRSRLPTEGLDGGSLQDELGHERVRWDAKSTPLARPPPKIDFLNFAAPRRPRPSAPRPASPPRASSSRMPPLDGMVAVPLTDTPMIRKNQEMRKEAQRRSSLGLRGQRMSSSLGRGEVSMPHSSVPSSTFYKHISPTLPEPIRAKHLLVWCAKRAPVVRGPTDTDLGDRLCRDIMDDLANLLGAGGVDTNVFADIPAASSSLPLQPHPRNVANRESEAREEAHVKRCKQEDAQWSALGRRANAKQAQVISRLESKQEPSLDGEEWIEQAAKAADDVLGEAVEDLGVLGDVEFKVDTLLQTSHTAMQYSLHATRFLDGVFASLAQDLRNRERAGPAKTDPMAMLRALAKADARHASQETITAATAVSPLPPTTTPRRPAAGMTPRRAGMTPRRGGTPYQKS